MTPEEQVVLDAKRMVSRGAWGILFGMGISTLLVIVFVALGAVFDEIAVVMACPIGTVRSRIFSAREAIATRLRPLLDTQQGRRW